ncbi:MAG: hypothetical protein SFU27_14395 [Thermonemataceae bacterium]|nr:hypothetical protein [Thermonemataceae bacterium]
MQLPEKINTIFGIIMVLIYLVGGTFVIIYAERLSANPPLAKTLGGIMLVYALIRASRVWNVLKQSKENNRKRFQ